MFLNLSKEIQKQESADLKTLIKKKLSKKMLPKSILIEFNLFLLVITNHCISGHKCSTHRSLW